MNVYINPDVYFVILNHALSTEVEEVVGLLFGDWHLDHTRVEALCILQRNDKRKDRVEIGPEQMCGAIETAEALTKKLGHPVRVVGWYHSHPHITALPSEVDVRTQASYQTMEDRWVGVIAAVFSEEPRTFSGTVDMICFRSQPDPATTFGDRLIYKLIPWQVLPECDEAGFVLSEHCLKTLGDIPETILNEEEAAYAKVLGTTTQKTNPLGSIQNACTFTKNVCKIVEGLMLPVLDELKRLREESQRELDAE